MARRIVGGPDTGDGGMTLAEAYRRMARLRGDGYRPRSRHLDESGGAIYTNRLFLESSPYLLQHAHNPVDWFPWGEEAFAAAAALDRPVLLSVGYATCHWCHVMEEESFEDEAIARFINDHYIAVKVDREERPDIDAVYMSAVQAVGGRGGWPMTVWLTPDRKPFYGGTYFPARDGDRGAPVGFLTLLQKIRQSYSQKRMLVDRSAEELTDAVRRMLTVDPGRRLPGDDVPARAVAACRNRFDAVHGGFAGAPKFPSSLPVRLLLRHHRRTGDPQSLEMAALTLQKMAGGGMNDQVGGGFHRYSTDDRWRVPHFEKMLYDNALLVPAYLDAWQATGNTRFRQVAAATLEYVAREMTAPQGTFYSATDADSLTPAGSRQEGYYFTWTQDELADVLGPEDARTAAFVYGVTPGGNFEGRSVLFLPRELDAAAAAMGVPTDRLAADKARIDAALCTHRGRRPPPLRDEKILAGWNGLMISAFARSGFALNDPSYTARAAGAASFILDRMVVGGRLKRSFKDGAARGSGFLDDHAFMIAALLDLFTATADRRWLGCAVDLQQTLDTHFGDRESGGYFMTADDHETLIAREKPIHDGALPSGNAVALMNLLRLYALTLAPAHRQRAEMALRGFSRAVEAHPAAFGEMLAALDDFHHPPHQVIVVTAYGGADSDMPLRLRQAFLPGSSIMIVSEAAAEALSVDAPLFRDKRVLNGRTTAYACLMGTCRPPVATLDDLFAQLGMQPRRP